MSTRSERPLRVGYDVSKVLSMDGIGTWSRELLRALATVIEADALAVELVPLALSEELRREDLVERIPELVTVKPGPVDLLHSNTWCWPEWAAGLPGFSTCYDLSFLTHPHCHTPHNRLRCLQGTLSVLQQRADFLAISEATRRDLVRWLGVQGDSVPVVYPAAAAQFQPQDLEAARARVKQRYGDGNFLLALGTVEPRKNLSRLLTAHRALSTERRQDYPLWIAGQLGWRSNELLRELEADEAVRLLGAVPDSELPSLYSAASIVLYPSLAEGFGLPVLEALACGGLVVTSDRSSLPEAAGDAALFVDPEDVQSLRLAITHLLAHPDEATGLRQRGPAWAQGFSWERSARKLLGHYSELARAARMPASAARPLVVQPA